MATDQHILIKTVAFDGDEAVCASWIQGGGVGGTLLVAFDRVPGRSIEKVKDMFRGIIAQAKVEGLLDRLLDRVGLHGGVQGDRR